MKIKSPFLLAALAVAAWPSVRAGDSPDPSRAGILPQYLPAAEPYCASCSAEVKPGSPAASLPALNLSNRSLYQVDAKWTNDAGETVQLASLRGQPVVIAMFFAHCEYACPMIVSDIQRLRASLPPAVRAKAQIVLVSFDTERDTPAALRNYRERMKLDASWTLLRGEAADVQELAMLLGVKFKPDARGQFAHSNLITVLNAEGEISYQRPGLQGDVSELAQAVVLAAKEAALVHGSPRAK